MNKMEMTDQRASFYSSNNGSRNRYLKFEDERFGNRNISGNINNSAQVSFNKLKSLFK